MYESFYGLSEMPFALQPDPAFLFFSRKHKLALTLLRYSVANKTLCSVITGEIGSGKTTLVRQLLSEMDPAIAVGLIFNTHRGMGDILKWISMSFGLAYQGKDKLDLHQGFLDFLLEKFVAGGHAMLIVDEAQNLAPEALEELRLVTNFNIEKDVLLQLILVGQPELRDTLRSTGFEQFAQRISVQYHLEPLERDETLQYIHHRLRVAGGDGRTFEDEACHKIWYYSRGIPRAINTLCDAAMLYAYADERKFVDRLLVEEVIEDRRRVGAMDLPDANDEPEPERYVAAPAASPPAPDDDPESPAEATPETSRKPDLPDTQPIKILKEASALAVVEVSGDAGGDDSDVLPPRSPKRKAVATSWLRKLVTLIGIVLLALCSPAVPSAEPTSGTGHAQGINASTLAVIVNDRDPLSRQIAEYYVEKRSIPPDNLIHVAFEPDKATLTVAQFSVIEPIFDDAAGPHIQALALAWALPYRVGCMSVTTAFAAGFDKKWCGGVCERTRGSAYFDSSIEAPWTKLSLRPAMLLAAQEFEEARELIDRGIAADGTAPRGTGYLVETKDAHRNSRATAFPAIVQRLGDEFRLEHVQAPQLENRDDVLFYFTGAAHVANLDSIGFLPGAVADHLTSAGGRLDGSKQMSSLRWLEAGATASYGTVVEPCNFPGKFPNPAVLIRHYLAGETLLEAYWKSVAMPGQGVFIGEPLARPFGDRAE